MKTKTINKESSFEEEREDLRPAHIGTNFCPDYDSMEYKKHYRG